ncbi:MAG: C-terminal binding protein [Caldilineaceae bacterium]|nr:C-terminal binding protein [Caldilineaceae bacterium]
MSRFTVLVTDYAWPTLAIEQAIFDQVGATLLVAQSGDEAELVRLAPQADAILTCWKQVTPAVVDAAIRCRHISRYGVGLDNIAVARATEQGIVVTNVPDFCVEEVSDHAMALLLACARGIVGFAQTTQAGRWDNKGQGVLPRLRGQTLGLVGFGNSARALLPKAHGFGLRVIAYTPRIAADALSTPDRATQDFDLLLRESDYISIHAPLTEATRHLFNEQALRAMKPTAYLINTARGAIIDEAALFNALEQGWLAGAALDVLTQEPPVPTHPLLRRSDVFVTPHAAFYSGTATEELAHKAACHVAQTLRGEEPQQIVNPQVLTQANCRLLRP